MPDKIKLKVPASIDIDFVGMGNFQTELPPGEVIEVEDRRFADWLVREYNLTEEGKPEDPNAAAYPEDYPNRRAFIKLGLSEIDVRGMDRDELIALKGVGEKGADAVLEYYAAEQQPGGENGGNE